jgi:hypothetical protein
MSEDNEDPTNKEMRQYAEKVKALKEGKKLSTSPSPSTAELERNDEYMKSVKPVQVVSIVIPFGDVLSLTFQAFCASLIIAIPIALILALINS